MRMLWIEGLPARFVGCGPGAAGRLPPGARGLLPWSACAVLLLSACGAGGLSYSGQREPQLAQPAQIASGEHVPEGLRRLGRVSAECSPPSAGSLPARARFSDLDCSLSLVLAALREGAADAGGSFLTQPQCRTDEEGERGARSLRWVGCDAEVWAPADRARFAAPELPERPINVDPLAAAAPGSPPFGAVREAWHVLIDFWPAAGPSRPVSRGPEDIAEVAFPRVGQVQLGDLVAHCDGECSVDSLRRGLRAGAARMGGSTLVGARCIVADGKPSCVASVAAPELDEGHFAVRR